MANVDIVFHPVAAELNSHITALILPDLQQGRQIAFLLPAERHIAGLKETLVRKADSLLPGQLYFGTYFAWANRILDAGRQSFRIIGAGEEWLLLFKYLKKNSRLFQNLKPGSLPLILKILTELRESGLTLNQLHDIGAKSADIAPFIRCLEPLFNAAADRQLASPPTLLMLAAEYLQKDGVLPVDDRLIVAGFYDFNPIQRKILNRLIDVYPATTLFYPATGDHPALKYLQPVQAVLENRDYRSAIIQNEDSEPPNLIADQVFRPRPSREHEEPAPLPFGNDWRQTALKLLRCPNRRQELDAAARTVRKWINEGINPEKIAVVYRGNYDYAKPARLIFRDAGIIIADKGQLLSEATPLRIIRKIFEINERNFSRESIIDLTRFAAIRRYYGVDIIQKFEHKSAAWGLSFNRESWLRQLTRRREYLQLVINAEADDLPERNSLRRELEDIDSLLPVLRRFLEDITLPAATGWSDYIRTAQTLLQKYCRTDQAETSTDNVFSAMKNLFRNLSGLVDAKDTVELRYFIMTLNNLIANITLPKPDIQEDTGVTVANLMDIRGERFKAIVLLGMVDGEFPVSRRENPLLNNRRRSNINQIAGAEILRRSETNIDEEKFLFYKLLQQADSHLLITCPQFDSSGRNLPASPFLDELIDHPEYGKSLRHETLSAAAVIPKIDLTVSRRDLLLNRMHYQWDDRDLRFFDQIPAGAVTPDLERRIAVEKRRKERVADGWSGRLSAPNHRKYCFAKPLSVTRLQQYAWCPFLYLCQNIWKVDTVEEPLAEVSALADGLLIHALFETFLKKAGPRNFEQWRAFITGDLSAAKDAALQNIHQRFRSAFAYIDEPVWQKKLTDLRRGLELFIKREIAALDSEFYPFEFEKKISFDFPVMLKNPQNSVKFKVKIDRIDRNGQNEVTLIEYKRSSKSVQDPVKGLSDGIHFQIPFYMLAYRHSDRKISYAGAYSYVFNEGRIARGIFTKALYKRVKPVADSEIDSLLKETEAKVAELLQRIYAGDFFLNPFDPKERCRQGKCPYYELCRIDNRLTEATIDTDE